jgi:C-terminal processing protease CtpA/Prc
MIGVLHCVSYSTESYGDIVMKTINSVLPTLKLVAFLIVLPHCSMLFGGYSAFAQSFGNQDRDRGITMLKIIKEDISKHYYDPTFRGIDLDARFKLAESKIKLAKSNAEVFGVIAQVLLDFNDSHTSFIPPQRQSGIEYGWLLKMFGDNCYITEVKPNSDAEGQGLKPGDEVLSIDGIRPTRSNIWIFYYLYYQLAPRPIVKMIVQSPGEPSRPLEVKTKVQITKRTIDLTDTIDLNKYLREEEDEEMMNAPRFRTFGADLIIWKMSQFNLAKGEVDEQIDKVKKHQALILDLRGNLGGAEETVLRLIGNLCDHDVTVGEMKRRKESKPLVAKTRGESGFKGKLVVLVDSDSASASEILARVVQLEKRGVVLGDRTSGKVMRSRVYPHEMGVDTVIVYGTSITDADIIMSDGVSLEGAGVTPNLVLLPKAADLRARRDPVLSGAAALLGVKLDAAEAGKLFPFKWRALNH